MRTKINPMPSTTLIILLFWLPSIIIRSSSAFRQDAGIITRKSTIKNISKASRLFATQQHHPSMNHPRMTRLVLVGGGHAHVQVIKSLNAQARPPNLHVTLVDMQSNASYSGMVPGCVAKLYTLDQVQIALDSLAEWADIEFVCGKVVGMSLDEEGANKDDIFEKLLLVEVDDENDGKVRKEIPFDVISLDIGSTTRDFSSIPGASQYTISTRPISELVQRIEREEEALKETLA